MKMFFQEVLSSLSIHYWKSNSRNIICGETLTLHNYFSTHAKKELPDCVFKPNFNGVLAAEEKSSNNFCIILCCYSKCTAVRFSY